MNNFYFTEGLYYGNTRFLVYFKLEFYRLYTLPMNYYVNFLGGIGSNGFHIKLIFGTQDN